MMKEPISTLVELLSEQLGSFRPGQKLHYEVRRKAARKGSSCIT